MDGLRRRGMKDAWGCTEKHNLTECGTAISAFQAMRRDHAKNFTHPLIIYHVPIPMFSSNCSYISVDLGTFILCWKSLSFYANYDTLRSILYIYGLSNHLDITTCLRYNEFINT